MVSLVDESLKRKQEISLLKRADGPAAARQARTAGAQPLSESEVRRDRINSRMRRRSSEGSGVSRGAGVERDLLRACRRKDSMNCEQARERFVDYWRGTLEDPGGEFPHSPGILRTLPRRSRRTEGHVEHARRAARGRSQPRHARALLRFAARAGASTKPSAASRSPGCVTRRFRPRPPWRFSCSALGQDIWCAAAIPRKFRNCAGRFTTCVNWLRFR